MEINAADNDASETGGERLKLAMLYIYGAETWATRKTD